MIDRRTWMVQVVPARDWFEYCTRPVEEWLADEHSDDGGRVRWLEVMQVCALVIDKIDAPGLRCGPRVGYDPVRDQMYFLFKADNNGTTILVSPMGFRLDPEETEF